MEDKQWLTDLATLTVNQLQAPTSSTRAFLWLNANEPTGALSSAVLSRAGQLAQSVAGLIEELQQLQPDLAGMRSRLGILLDIEPILPAQLNAYVALLERVRAELETRGLGAIRLGVYTMKIKSTVGDWFWTPTQFSDVAARVNLLMYGAYDYGDEVGWLPWKTYRSRVATDVDKLGPIGLAAKTIVLVSTQSPTESHSAYETFEEGIEGIRGASSVGQLGGAGFFQLWGAQPGEGTLPGSDPTTSQWQSLKSAYSALPTWSYSDCTSAIHSTRIAYSSNESGRTNIHTVALDGSFAVLSRQRLTDSTTVSTNPTWSIDGQTIAYRYGTYNNEIWTMAADTGGTKERKITVGLNKFPTAWSLDPRYVYGNNSYAGDGEVARFDLVNDSVTMLTAVSGYNTQSFSLNSGQSKIAFVRGVEGNGWTNKLYVADFTSDGTDFKNQIPLSAAAPSPHEPRFSPSGDRIAFIIATSSSYAGIGIVNSSGGGFWTPLPIATTGTAGSMAWIDENHLVFSYGTTSNQNLYILDLRDLSSRPITSTSGWKGDIAVFRR